MGEKVSRISRWQRAHARTIARRRYLLAQQRDEIQVAMAGLDGDPGSVIDRWIIVREPGCVPEKKKPPRRGYEGLLDMLRELVECRPAGTHLTVVEVTWNSDLSVRDGREMLTIDAAMTKACRQREIASPPQPGGPSIATHSASIRSPGRHAETISR